MNNSLFFLQGEIHFSTVRSRVDKQSLHRQMQAFRGFTTCRYENIHTGFGYQGWRKKESTHLYTDSLFKEAKPRQKKKHLKNIDLRTQTFTITHPWGGEAHHIVC